MKMREKNRKNMRADLRAQLPAYAVAALMIGCFAPKALADETVKVYFDQNGCPIAVDKIFFQVSHPEKVHWQAVDLNNQNINEQFAVYFSPFVGPGINSNSSGKASSVPVQKNVPKGVLYKYTIAKPPETDQSACVPLDPVFRVN